MIAARRLGASTPGRRRHVRGTTRPRQRAPTTTRPGQANHRRRRCGGRAGSPSLDVGDEPAGEVRRADRGGGLVAVACDVSLGWKLPRDGFSTRTVSPGPARPEAPSWSTQDGAGHQPAAAAVWPKTRDTRLRSWPDLALALIIGCDSSPLEEPSGPTQTVESRRLFGHIRHLFGRSTGSSRTCLSATTSETRASRRS